MAAHVLLDEENRHPLIRHAMALQSRLTEWANEIEKPRRALLLEGQDKLDDLEKALAISRTELADLRTRLVLEGLDLKRLTTTRKRIAELESNIADWTAGLLEARRVLAVRLGSIATNKGARVAMLAGHIRDGRAQIASNLEYDRRTPPRHLEHLGAHISAAATALDDCMAAVAEHGDVPTEVASHAEAIRRQLGLIRNETNLSANLQVA